MDDQKQQLAERLGSANNILVTVSSNPTVDQLAACIGLTLALNKLDKHATAVFSGDVPDTIEFLKPEETLEQNTDSLRDFIIALDKSKADKLRYKVEDKVVKIFITPYRTSITQEDLNFSQGDFNVDVDVAQGVRQQQDLDQAITAHGRILHDATVASVSIDSKGSELGSINWRNPDASSLSEVVTTLLKQIDKKLLDEQSATALLTGIVASTDRFRSDNTTATTMSVSADLMAAGANQQLVTSELEHAVELHEEPKHKAKESKKPADESSDKDGTLEINHKTKDESVLPEETLPPEPEQTLPKPVDELPEIHAVKSDPDAGKEPTPTDSGRDVMTERPVFDTALTAADRHEEQTFQPSADFAKPGEEPKLLSHDNELKQSEGQPPQETGALDVASAHPEPSAPAPPVPSSPPPQLPTQPDIPEPSHSEPPAAPAPGPDLSPGSDVDAARDEVMRALSEQSDEAMPPIAALNAQPLGERLHEPEPPQPTAAEPAPSAEPPRPPGPAPLSPADQPLDMPLPPKGNIQVPPPQTNSPTNAPAAGPGAPPPVPPPMTPPSWPGPQQ
jgi:nanoRNase/pAp phosphatase (c-di-AMP/oligoRNAs hydrolase)